MSQDASDQTISEEIEGLLIAALPTTMDEVCDLLPHLPNSPARSELSAGLGTHLIMRNEEALRLLRMTARQLCKEINSGMHISTRVQNGIRKAARKISDSRRWAKVPALEVIQMLLCRRTRPDKFGEVSLRKLAHFLMDKGIQVIYCREGYRLPEHLIQAALADSAD